MPVYHTSPALSRRSTKSKMVRHRVIPISSAPFLLITIITIKCMLVSILSPIERYHHICCSQIASSTKSKMARHRVMPVSSAPLLLIMTLTIGCWSPSCLLSNAVITSAAAAAQSLIHSSITSSAFHPHSRRALSGFVTSPRCVSSDRSASYDVSDLIRKEGGSDDEKTSSYSKSVQVGAGIQFVYRLNVLKSVSKKCSTQEGAVTESLVLSGGETCRVLGRADEDVEMSCSNAKDDVEKVTITYKNGDSCDPTSGKKREAIVEIECDKEGSRETGSGDLVSMEKIDPCKTSFKMKSYFACSEATRGVGGSGGTSFAVTFLWVFFASMFAYCAVGVAYNYKVHALRGTETIPHREFWTEVPGLVVVGVTYTSEQAKRAFDSVRSKHDGVPLDDDDLDGM